MFQNRSIKLADLGSASFAVRKLDFDDEHVGTADENKVWLAEALSVTVTKDKPLPM